ncbi:MAG: hypothetical protein U0231_12265 [Nitrospiraceae bacterium]
MKTWGDWATAFETLFRGLSLSSILLIMSLGLAIVFGLMGVINMAHGELIMIGAYATFLRAAGLQGLVPRGLKPDGTILRCRRRFWPLRFAVSCWNGP